MTNGDDIPKWLGNTLTGCSSVLMASCAALFLIGVFQGCTDGSKGASPNGTTIDRFGNLQEHYPDDELERWIEEGSTETEEITDYGMAYANCDEAREYDHAPVYEGEAEYAPHLDRDGDGIGCEPWDGD